MYLDAHFHTIVYNRYEGSLDLALRLLKEEKILVISNSCTIPEYQDTLDIAKKSSFVLPAFGIHPQMAPEYINKIKSIQPYLDQSIVFGEIGLDHIHVTDSSQYPAQRKILEAFFKAAKEQNKIVFLHLDGAEEEGLKQIKKYKLDKAVVHGYRGSLETFYQLIEEGCYFSIGGNAIMEKFKPIIQPEDWERVQTIVKEIPNIQLLIESDGPCRTAPEVSWDAPRSMPTYIKDIVSTVASLRNTTTERLIDQTTHNFLKLIGEDKRLKNFKTLLMN